MFHSSYNRYSSRSFRPGKLQLLAILVAMITAVAIVGGWVFANAAWYKKPGNDAGTVKLTITSGERFTRVAEDLQDAGVANAFWLRVYTKLFDDATIYPGDYQVTMGSSYEDIMKDLHGDGREVVRITIPEGFTLAKMGERVHEALPDVSLEEWAAVTSATSALAADPFVTSAGKPAGVDLEGYLFPDTYEFATDATAEIVAEKMLRTMEGHINDIGTVTGDAAGMTMHELLTLASIVEREVRTKEAMQNVADVFLKRLEINMPLQSDATINYIINGDDPSPLYSDLEVESPYNTYKNPGLPPGPISSPGLNALNAVLHPVNNSYYYFLTTDNGNIYYGETYDEHLRNKAKYL